MNITDKIRDIIEPSLVAMGYSIVLLKLNDAKRKTLTIMAERADDAPMSFADCTNITHTASALLDVNDPIPTAYDLEVCSPGIERPLTRPEDYTRFAGQEAKVETLLPIDGRKRFRGVIEGIAGEVITLRLPEGNPVAISYPHVRNAKLAVAEMAAKSAKKKK